MQVNKLKLASIALLPTNEIAGCESCMFELPTTCDIVLAYRKC